MLAGNVVTCAAKESTQITDRATGVHPYSNDCLAPARVSPFEVDGGL